MRCSTNLVFRAMLFVLLIWNFGNSQTPRSFHANLTIGKQSAYQYIIPPIHGKVAFTRLGRIKVIIIGDTVSQDMGLNGVASGHVVEFVRWSSDGQKLAVLTRNGLTARGNVYVMNASKNAPLTLLVSDADWTPNCTIGFHTNGNEILYAKSSVLWAIDINTKNTRRPFNTSDCNGEMGVSADGNRIVWRGAGNMLYKYDFTSQISKNYNPNAVCSAGISPDGTLVMNNTTAHTDAYGTFEEHKTLQIWSFDTTGVLRTELILTDGLPDPHWDNHHWSNSNDWIAGKGHDNSGAWGEAYIINVSNNITYRVTWERSADYPDLWVDTTYTPTSVKTNISSSSTSGRTGVQLTYANGFPQLSISITGNHDVRVYNILGQLLQSQDGYGPSSYSFPHLHSGLYFIQVRTQQGTAVQKMAIIR